MSKGPCMKMEMKMKMAHFFTSIESHASKGP
jgi:hypothetical protein